MVDLQQVYEQLQGLVQPALGRSPQPPDCLDPLQVLNQESTVIANTRIHVVQTTKSKFLIDELRFATIMLNMKPSVTVFVDNKNHMYLVDTNQVLNHLQLDKKTSEVLLFRYQKIVAQDEQFRVSHKIKPSTVKKLASHKITQPVVPPRKDSTSLSRSRLHIDSVDDVNCDLPPRQDVVVPPLPPKKKLSSEHLTRLKQAREKLQY